MVAYQEALSAQKMKLSPNNRTRYVGNYSEEKVTTLICSNAQDRLQESKTGIALDS